MSFASKKIDQRPSQREEREPEKPKLPTRDEKIAANALLTLNETPVVFPPKTINTISAKYDEIKNKTKKKEAKEYVKTLTNLYASCVGQTLVKKFHFKYTCLHKNNDVTCDVERDHESKMVYHLASHLPENVQLTCPSDKCNLKSRNFNVILYNHKKHEQGS